MRKPSRKTLKNKCDKLFSQFIRSRGKCEWCLKKLPPSKLHAAHIFSRRFLITRWNFNNCLALCPGCHFRGHEEPLEFAEFVKNKLGEEKYHRLRRERHEIKKCNLEDIVKVLKELNE